MKEIYTIGYASHSLDSFLEELEKHSINVVADVRSQPYSRFKSEFNREALAAALKQQGISYVFMGDCCGARGSDAQSNVNGKTDYGEMAKSPSFLDGLQRIREDINKGHHIDLFHLDQPDMWQQEKDRLEEAYDLQGDKIAFHKG